jgi:hypothetical protein
MRLLGRVVRNKLGLTLVSEKTDEERAYRIIARKAPACGGVGCRGRWASTLDRPGAADLLLQEEHAVEQRLRGRGAAGHVPSRSSCQLWKNPFVRLWRAAEAETKAAACCNCRIWRPTMSAAHR